MSEGNSTKSLSRYAEKSFEQKVREFANSRIQSSSATFLFRETVTRFCDKGDEILGVKSKCKRLSLSLSYISNTGKISLKIPRKRHI